jgi:hypothetical protein
MGLKEHLGIEISKRMNYYVFSVMGLPSKQVQFQDEETKFTVSTQFIVFKNQDKMFIMHKPTQATFFNVTVSSGRIVEPSFLADRKIEGTIDMYDEHNFVMNDRLFFNFLFSSFVYDGDKFLVFAKIPHEDKKSIAECDVVIYDGNELTEKSECYTDIPYTPTALSEDSNAKENENYHRHLIYVPAEDMAYFIDKDRIVKIDNIFEKLAKRYNVSNADKMVLKTPSSDSVDVHLVFYKQVQDSQNDKKLQIVKKIPLNQVLEDLAQTINAKESDTLEKEI